MIPTALVPKHIDGMKANKPINECFTLWTNKKALVHSGKHAWKKTFVFFLLKAGIEPAWRLLEQPLRSKPYSLRSCSRSTAIAFVPAAK